MTDELFCRQARVIERIKEDIKMERENAKGNTNVEKKMKGRSFEKEIQ